MLPRTQPGKKGQRGDGRARRALPGYAPPPRRGSTPGLRGRQGPWATRLPARRARRCRCRLRLPPMAVSLGSPASALGAAARPADRGVARPAPAAASQGPASRARSALSEPDMQPVAGLQLLPGTPGTRARPQRRRGRCAGMERTRAVEDEGLGAAGGRGSRRGKLGAGPRWQRALVPLAPDDACI